MVKCFWCGAEQDRHQETCTVCKRKLEWSRFFIGMLKPSMGFLFGNQTNVSNDTSLTTVAR
ncbi:MAG: hypothetical protein SNJ70_00785 [Armatimonadota bacterium]